MDMEHNGEVRQHCHHTQQTCTLIHQETTIQYAKIHCYKNGEYRMIAQGRVHWSCHLLLLLG